MNLRFALAAVAVLDLAGCASTSTGPLPAPPPVNVIITAAPSLANVIDVAKTTAQTELALRRYASAAPPATVMVHLDDVALISGAEMGAAMHGGAVPATYVSPEGVLSLTGWPEGFIPTTHTMPEGTRVVGSELKVRGTYAIIDESGATIDEGPLIAPTGNNQQALARRLAMRVAQLARTPTRKRS